MWKSILDRLKEPSSWSAIAAILVLFNVTVPEDLWGYVVWAGAGLAGIAAFFLKEGKKA